MYNVMAVEQLKETIKRGTQKNHNFQPNWIFGQKVKWSPHFEKGTQKCDCNDKHTDSGIPKKFFNSRITNTSEQNECTIFFISVTIYMQHVWFMLQCNTQFNLLFKPPIRACHSKLNAINKISLCIHAINVFLKYFNPFT